MPITMTLIDTGIIHQTWKDCISADDLLKGTQELTELLKQHQIKQFITIVDASEVTKFEINLHVLRHITELGSEEIAIYVVNPPSFSGMLVKIIARLVPNKKIQVCMSVEHARQLADAQLQALRASRT